VNARPERVVAAVADAFLVSASDVLGKNRHLTAVSARRAAAYLLRVQGFSFPEIGLLLGQRDHTTAMHHVQRAEEILCGPGNQEEALFVKRLLAAQRALSSASVVSAQDVESGARVRVAEWRVA
jgi:hypothetical protein